jgi:hypothetical protein
MNRFLCGLVAFSVLGLLGAGCMAGSPDEGDEEVGVSEAAPSTDIAPDGKGSVTKDQAEHRAKQAGYGISYHGGPVMLGTVNAYFIWYGNWSGNSATTILTDFASSLGGSSWWNINSTYTNSSGTHISNSFNYAGSTTDSYSQGTALSDAQIQTIVSSAITGGKLPKDTNGIYFVLTSSDVNATSGFCTQYCGWHTHGTIGGSDIKYSFVGNPDRCPSACEDQSASSPNSNPGADGMASILAHEAAEATTDPDLNAWYDSKGYENADKCAWTFGTTYSAANGSLANIHLGSRDYLIQRNWANVSPSGKCTMSYP